MYLDSVIWQPGHIYRGRMVWKSQGDTKITVTSFGPVYGRSQEISNTSLSSKHSSQLWEARAKSKKIGQEMDENLVPESWRLSQKAWRYGYAALFCSPRTWDTQAERSSHVWGQLSLHGEFQTHQCCTQPRVPCRLAWVWWESFAICAIYTYKDEDAQRLLEMEGVWTLERKSWCSFTLYVGFRDLSFTFRTGHKSYSW